jgi:hypothetical protein
MATVCWLYCLPALPQHGLKVAYVVQGRPLLHGTIHMDPEVSGWAGGYSGSAFITASPEP